MKNTIIREDIETVISSDLEWEKLAGKTILITGVSGFLASYITRTILHLNDTVFAKKATVIGLIRNLPKAQSKFSDCLDRDDLILQTQDISTPFELDMDIHFIIHAASPASSKHFSADPVGTLKANIIGTSSLLDIARNNDIERFLFLSSGEVYGMLDGIDGCVDETHTGDVNCLDVRSCYAESKRMAENMCACWSHQYGIQSSIVRVGYTYGPGLPLSDDRVVADFVHKIINNKNLDLNSDGSACRSFCYITDMIEALFRVFFRGENGEAYNAASGIQTSILELAETLVKLFPEKGLQANVMGRKIDEGYLRSVRKKTLVCTEKIQGLGWEQKVDITTGLRRMVESYL